MKKGAIFDMDGLMFDTEAIWQKCWSDIADERKIVLEPQFRKDICGTSGKLMNSVIEKYYHVEDGAPIAADCKNRVHAALKEHVPEKPGVHEILSWLHDQGVKIAVASSSTQEQIHNNLHMTNTEKYINAVLSGTEIERGKPAPDLFLKAAEKIGIAPEDCYVFEDAYNGVRAGAASGARTIMIPDTQEPDDEMYELAFAICGSLLDALEEIQAGRI